MVSFLGDRIWRQILSRNAAFNSGWTHSTCTQGRLLNVSSVRSNDSALLIVAQGSTVNPDSGERTMPFAKDSAVELLPGEKDAMDGSAMIKYLAMVGAWLGNKDLACEQLAVVIRQPSGLSYGELKLLPFWDPLRGDPRFEKIVEERPRNRSR